MSNILDIDLNRTGGRQTLPAGTYKVRIEKIEQKQKAGGQYPYLKFTLRVLDDRGKPGTNLLWTNVSLSPNSRFIMDQLLDAIDAPSEGKITANWFRNKALWVAVKVEDYKGTDSNQVESFLTPAKAAIRLEAEGKTVPDSLLTVSSDVFGDYADDPEIDETDDEENILNDSDDSDDSDDTSDEDDGSTPF